MPAHLVKAHEAQEVLNAGNLIEHLQRLREETLEILAEARTSRDLGTALKAVARAESQLRLAAELLGLLRNKVDLDVRVVRSFKDLRQDELEAFMREAEALIPAEPETKLLAPPASL